MATKLKQLLDELTMLKEYFAQDLLVNGLTEMVVLKDDLEELIDKYTETTPTYKLGDSDEIIEQETLKLYNEMFNNPYEEEIRRRDILEYGKRVIKAVAEKNLNQ